MADYEQEMAQKVRIEILKWEENFEQTTRNRRPRAPMAWFTWRVGGDSNGWIELSELGAAGSAVLGVFIKLAELAANRPIDERGTIARSDGSHISLKVIGIKTRLKAETLLFALNELARIGWIEVSDENGAPFVSSCSRLCGQVSNCLYTTGQDTTIQRQDITIHRSFPKKEKTAPSETAQVGEITQKKKDARYSPEFETFWKIYPPTRKNKKGDCYKHWNLALKDTDPEEIIRAAAEFASSPEGMGAYCPSPSPWLNQRRWEDDRSSWVTNQINGAPKITAASARNTNTEKGLLDWAAKQQTQNRIEGN
jgi:hypothetical protein